MTQNNSEIIKKLMEYGLSIDKSGQIMGISSKNIHENPQSPQFPFPDGQAPNFIDKIKKSLPKLILLALNRLKKSKDKDQRKNFKGLQDIVVITMITVLSAVLPNVRLFYNKTWYYATTMLLVIANAGMGKGIMDGIFQLLTPICKLWEQRYEAEVEAYTNQQFLLSTMSREEKRNYHEKILEKPRHYLFRIPTDSTYAAFIKALERMKGQGAVVDTEIDTMIHAFAQDMGDYSVLIRKNFKHELHDWYRKTDDESGKIDEPKFAMAMSGTLDQLKNFVNNISNGFFSRLLYYFYCARPVWQDAENEDDEEMDDKTYFESLGQQLLHFYLKLEALETPVRFHITDGQRKKLNAYFSTIHGNYLALEGVDIHATVVRLAVSLQRIAMVLTMIRLLEKTDAEIDETLMSGHIYCGNKDFNTALIISNVLIQHISAYYEMLKNREAHDEDEEYVEPADFGRDDVNKGFNSLPANRKLTREEIVNALVKAEVPKSTAEKYIDKFLKSLRLKKIAHNQYRKCSDKEYLMLKKSAKPKDTKKGKKK